MRIAVIATVTALFITTVWSVALAVERTNGKSPQPASSCTTFEDGSKRCLNDEQRLMFCLDHSASVPELSECYHNV